ALIDRDKTVVSPSYTRGYPLVIERGSGATVEDVDGNVFLDCAAGIAVNATGHSHPEVVKAVTEQANRFLHMSGTDFYYEPQVRLAEDLAALAPIDGGVRSFFGNSGTEAIEACVKLARYSTKRDNIIAFLGGFHGRTLGALSLSASKAIPRRGVGPRAPAGVRRCAESSDGGAARRAREHVRGQSGFGGCGDRDTPPAERPADGERGRRRRAPHVGPESADAEASADRRGPRPRADDRRR